MRSQVERAAAFRALHEGPPFVVPNPWDVGSARVLEAMGFQAGHHQLGLRLHAGPARRQRDARRGRFPRVRLDAGDRPPRLRRSGERLRRHFGAPCQGDRPGGGGGGRHRRLDRGLGPQRPPVRQGPRRRADPRPPPRRRTRSRSPSCRPRGRRTTSAATRISTTRSLASRRRGLGGRRPVRARPADPGGGPGRLSGGLPAGERARAAGHVDDRDRRGGCPARERRRWSHLGRGRRDGRRGDRHP